MERKKMIIQHKSNKKYRKTVCGLYYDELMRNSSQNLSSRLKGYWGLVTCKNCLKAKKNYEKILNK